MDCFTPFFPEQRINQISILGLAYVGDCVYELLVRTWLLNHEHSSSVDLHRSTVSVVNAKAQAIAARKLLPILEENELAVFKRGRNAKVNSVPQKATQAEYHSATGLEAVFGWLYLSGKQERIQQLFEMIMEDY